MTRIWLTPYTFVVFRQIFISQNLASAMYREAACWFEQGLYMTKASIPALIRG